MTVGKPLMSMRLETKRFSRFVKNYIKTLDENAETALRAISVVVLAKVIDLNPVRFGRSRAGWTAAGEMLGVDVPPGPDDMVEEEYGEASIDGNGARYTIRLTNGVEYTVHLERGTSDQAPFGMVRVSMRQVEQELGGMQALPRAVTEIYAQTWENLGRPAGDMRARLIMQAMDASAIERPVAA